MNSRLIVGAMLATALHVDLLAQPVTPLCGPIPHQGSPHFEHLMGGTLKRSTLWVDPADAQHVRVWIAEDGGRVRHSDDGGISWEMQDTPPDVAQMLIHIAFQPDGQTGHATGRGGHILKTTDAGANWNHLNPANPVVYAKDGNPAVQWGLHFFSDNQNVGIKCGLWDFQSTINGGASWSDLDLFTDAAMTQQADSMDFEFYFLEIWGTVGGGWKGLAGANWETNTPDGIKHGVMFYTDSTQPQFSLGRRWVKTFDQPETIINEPWDFEHDGNGNGCMVGGVGSDEGSIWMTSDFGLSWTEEHEDPSTTRHFATLYGVANLGGGNAIAVGYAGNIWVRNPMTATWTDHLVAGYTAPLADAHGIRGTPRAWVTGSFGFLRETIDGGLSWPIANNGEIRLRTTDIHFIDRNNGIAVGQPAQIFRTADAGCHFTKVWPASGFGGAQLNAVTMESALKGMAVGNNGLVVATADGGFTWAPAAGGITNSMHLNGLTRRTGSEYWAVGQDTSSGQALVVVYDALTATWNNLGSLPGGANTTLQSIAFSSATRAFLVGGRGSLAKAWRYDAGAVPLFLEVSPPADPAGDDRALNDVTAGILHGVRTIFAVGNNGTLLRFDDPTTSFVGVTGVYEFIPGTGVVTLQSTDHDYNVVGILTAHNHVLVGSKYLDDLAFSLQTGYVLRYDGSGWGTVKSLSNHHSKALFFVNSTTGWRGYLAGTNGPGGTIHGTIGDTTLHLYVP